MGSESVLFRGPREDTTIKYAEPETLLEDEELPLARLASHPRLAEVYDWWASHSPAPRRLEVDPLIFPAALLSRLILLDVEAPDRFRTRLAGTDVCADRGRELRGLLLEDFHRPEELEQVVAPLRRVAKTWAPDLRRRRYRTATLADHCYLRLALPLSDDGTEVTGLLLASQPVA